MKNILLALCLLTSQIVLADEGIKFENLKWQEVLKKAAAENKPLYLDIYTTWCGPCKMMAKNYFPTKEAGDFYNKNFVCYKLDAEADEGIEVAKKYNITGYPTNLFIDGKTGNVIYRTMGMPMDLAGFITNGHTALLEQKDPMTLPQYDAKFKTGKYDEAFLKKYLEKNKRLEVNNDAVIDEYLKKYSKQKSMDSLVNFVRNYQSGVLNEGYKFLDKNQSIINKEDVGTWAEMKKYFYGNALNHVIETKDESTFLSLLNNGHQYDPLTDIGSKYYYQREFYRSTRNKEKLNEVTQQFAQSVMKMSNNDIAALSAQSKDSDEKMIRSQLKMAGVADDKLEELVKTNLEKPRLKYQKELSFATYLNEIAWKIFEKNNAAKTINTEEVKNAAAWANRAMQLSEPVTESYVMIGDTYANLMYLLGQKEEAIKVQTSIIERGKKENMEGLDELIENLEKMKQ